MSNTKREVRIVLRLGVADSFATLFEGEVIATDDPAEAIIERVNNATEVAR
jgi:hypothetical protein